MSTTTGGSSSGVSLLDLTCQFPFEIDDQLKKELTFAETLIISCAHYEGKVQQDGEDDESEDEHAEGETASRTWSCSHTTSESTVVPPEPEPFEVKDYVEEAQPEEEPEEDNDFHLYFFPDCKKPPPTADSKQSLIIVDGMPQINPNANKLDVCTCEKNRKGDCECHIKLPCKCGAKKKNECICKNVREICVCHDTPNTKCTCFQDPRVCTCFPGLPRPVCVCADEVDKPCICQKGKYPTPVCDCKFKPDFRPKPPSNISSVTSAPEAEEMNAFDDYFGSLSGLYPSKKDLEDVIGEEPCDCQKPPSKEKCLCLKCKQCLCNPDMCICGAQKTCVCVPSSEGSEPVCKSQPSSLKIVCECPVPQECTCEAKGIECKCFPKKVHCTCGDPENCKCRNICDCKEPCICDTRPQKLEECVCLDRDKQLKAGLVCTCPCKPKDPNKLKRVRAGKEGYRWCHDVDPYHTFFDYAYGLHDKIDYKQQEQEKFKILGLYDDKKEDVCPVHGIYLPQFEKRVRKPSLDCCSSVGGITISVETLGELKDKFLVQVVSHASKEGARTGSKLVSIIDTNLHTLEENRIEHITRRNTTKQRKSYMAICDNGYYNKVTRACGDKQVVKRFYHTFEQAKEFLLEGANIVLMRYFGLRRYKGTVRTQTVLMDGTVCESIYVSLGVSQAIVNGKALFVVKVERHLIEPDGFIHQTLTVLSLRGYIISHEWADKSYVLHINPLLKITPEKDLIEDHSPTRERWREDLQLLSDYLDFKTTRTHEGARYVAENGMLTATVRDYLQAILMLRPADVVNFTREYFSSALSSMDLPRDEYFEPMRKHVRYFYFEE
ncbi:hypothetical protein NE865_11736 [Phthorimaea operculella]|nr:hypothetical protein NE865_11736 [Phthorimaea operculella]